MTGRLPAWLRQSLPDASVLDTLRQLSSNGLRTVCQQAFCPNISDCLKNKEFTFIILGDACTRNCRFCAVKKALPGSVEVDYGEPGRIAQAVKSFALDYAVITSVCRDDLEDGGAEIFFSTIQAVRLENPHTQIEVLLPDFSGKVSSLARVLAAGPDAVGHNLETVRRLYPDLRPYAEYGRSLAVLKKIKELSSGIVTKSSLMLGLGEREGEVIEAMRDLRDNDCDILTLGQYLAPSSGHYPVAEFITPEQFLKYKDAARGLGFKAVSSGAKVRSSYRAKELLGELNYA